MSAPTLFHNPRKFGPCRDDEVFCARQADEECSTAVHHCVKLRVFGGKFCRDIAGQQRTCLRRVGVAGICRAQGHLHHLPRWHQAKSREGDPSIGPVTGNHQVCRGLRPPKKRNTAPRLCAIDPIAGRWATVFPIGDRGRDGSRNRGSNNRLCRAGWRGCRSARREQQRCKDCPSYGDQPHMAFVRRPTAFGKARRWQSATAQAHCNAPPPALRRLPRMRGCSSVGRAHRSQ